PRLDRRPPKPSGISASRRILSLRIPRWGSWSTKRPIGRTRFYNLNSEEGLARQESTKLFCVCRTLYRDRHDAAGKYVRGLRNWLRNRHLRAYALLQDRFPVVGSQYGIPATRPATAAGYERQVIA